MIYHTPVMLYETISSLNLLEDSTVIDCTCGEGGHALEILKRIPSGRLICLDRNPEILPVAKERLSGFTNVSFYNITYDKISEVLAQENLNGVDAILADLGISMFHLKTGEDDSGRSFGISYTDENSLDMRLDGIGITAEEVVNRYQEKQIADILYKYGEEFESRPIARAIVHYRPYTNAKALADVVMRAKRQKPGKTHPATKTFQALRIFINKELEILESFIPHAVDNLSAQGRLAVLSYHSLEDRIVKHTLRALESGGLGHVMTKKPLIPNDEEIRTNRAARSAKLRIFEKRGQVDE